MTTELEERRERDIERLESNVRNLRLSRLEMISRRGIVTAVI